VLDIDSLSKGRLQALSAVFDGFKDKEPARIPDQYGLHGDFDQVGIDIDLAFLNAIGIEAKAENPTPLYHEIGAALGQWMGA